MFYRPGEEEFEADLDENEVEENQNKPKKHKIVARGNIKNFTKQQIKDTMFAAGVTLAFALMPAGLNMCGIVSVSVLSFIAKKGLNLAGRKLFGKKHNIIKREKTAKFSDYVKMTISSAALLTPVLLGGNIATIGVAIAGAVTLSAKVISLLIKDKKLNSEIDKQNRDARRTAREQARQAREQNRPTEEEQNEDENVDENEDENQNQNGGRTR